MEPMESPPQGKGDEAPSVLPSATIAGGSGGSGGGAGRFECSLGLDEQVKNIEKCFHFVIGRYAINDKENEEEELEWFKANIKRLRMDPRVDFQMKAVRAVRVGHSEITYLQRSVCEGATALHLAVMASDSRMVQKILESGSEVKIDGCMSAAALTALHLAIVGGNIDILDALERNGADPKLLAGYTTSIFRLAVESGHEEAVKWVLGQSPSLVNAGDAQMQTALHMAAALGNMNIMGALVEMGADLLAVSHSMQSILHLAVEGGHEETVKWVLARSPSLVNAGDAQMQTALHMAAALGNMNIMGALVEMGADLLAVSHSMQSILHLAVEGGHEEAVKWVLARSPSFVNARDNKEQTPLHMAAALGNMSIMCALLEKGANPLAVTQSMQSILHLAVEGGHEEMVKWILDRSPSLANTGDDKNQTPLHLAVGRARAIRRSVALGAVKSLCKCPDTDMKAWDNYGWSAFYHGVESGNAEVVIELLESGKDRFRLNEVCDKELGPPIQIACERGHKDIEIALMECEAVKGYIATLYRDRQVYVDSANAILVGAALIASVTFASWLQPPLNYTSYFGEEHSNIVPSPSSLDLNYADLEHNAGLRAFWVFNALSFYFAMATVVWGAATVIPRTKLFIKDAVEKLASSLLWTSILLACSVICVIIAFAIAGSIVVTPLLKYKWYMTCPTIVGGGVCIFSLGYLFKIVLENNGLLEITRKVS